MTHKLIKTDNYLLVVDDSDMVGKGYRLDVTRMSVGIIDDDFLYNARKDWFKKIIAHLPLNGLPILEGVPLLPPLEDDVEKLGNRMFRDKIDSLEEIHSDYILGVTEGYNKAREKYKYTEEDMRNAYIKGKHGGATEQYQEIDEYIQSINQYPAEFETEDVLTPSQIFYPNDVPYYSPKTITTAQGVQWVGKYK